MDNTNLLVVKSENKELLTQEEMAAKLNVSVATVCNHLRARGVEPVVPANRTMGVAAKYDIQAFLNLEEEEKRERKLREERERALKEKQQLLIKKHVDALTIDERSEVMHETIEELRTDFSHEATEAIMANALGFMQMLYERIGHQEVVIGQLGDNNAELKRQLDCEQNTGTLEKFNEEYNWHATAVQLSVLSRRLGKHYTRTRAVSIEHPDGVWSYERSDVLDSIERFPQFWEGIL